MLIRRQCEKLRKAFLYEFQSTLLKVLMSQFSALQIDVHSFSEESWSFMYLVMCDVMVEKSNFMETSNEGGSMTSFLGL